VRQIYPQLGIDQDVLVLYVTMDDPLSVQVPDGLDYLPKHELGLVFGKSFPGGLLDTFEKIVGSSSPRGGFVGLRAFRVRKRAFVWGRGEQLRFEHRGRRRL
jgi:hypothetical protein